MSKITAKELAAMLDGREYLHEITEAEEQIAKDNELVVMFGRSDDLAGLYGAIDDESGCFDGGELYLNNHGFIDAEDDEEINELIPYIVINAIWEPDCGGRWAYETNIPHETFRIFDEGELYCTGIVFNTKDLPGTLEDELACLAEYRAICPDTKKLKAELERAKQVKRERDAAVRDIEIMLHNDDASCLVCKWHDGNYCRCTPDERRGVVVCREAAEWRGVKGDGTQLAF